MMIGRFAPYRPLLLAVSVALPCTFTAAPATAQQEHREILAEKFRAELRQISDDVPGVLGVAVVDLSTDERFGVNESLVFPQGSSIKIPILIELYRQVEVGRVQLEESVPLRAPDQTGGSGILRHFSDGTSRLSLHDLAVLMIVLSDNTATNLLIDRLGMESVNRTMQELGLPSIRLQRKMIRPEESARGNENLATPADAAALMARIAHCEWPISAAHCAELRSILEIPKSGALVAPLPAGTQVAWKPGGIEGASTAWGVVALPGRPYAVAVMANYTRSDPAAEAIRKVSAASHEYFSRLAGSTPYGARVAPELLENTARPPKR